MPEILETSFITIQPSGKTYELKDASARTNLVTLTDDISNFDLELEAIKKSVSDGKILLADAITQKGVITEADSELPFMAEQILKIRSGGGHSGRYYSNFWVSSSKVNVFNGYPYVYVNYAGNNPSNNNIAVIADYTWRGSNDWHLLSQYYKSNEDTPWLQGLFVMGLYNEETQLGMGVYTNRSDSTQPFSEFIIRCYTSQSPNAYVEFNSAVDAASMSALTKIIFDLHYVYDESTGQGRLELKYADATMEVLNWVTIYSQNITLANNSFGKPVYLTGPSNLCGYSYGYTSRWLNIGECALVLDGYIDWGNSTLFPFRAGETPY